MSGDLDSFLKGGTPPEASPPTSTDGGKAAPATPEAPKPAPQAAPTKDATPAKTGTAVPEPDDDAETGDPEPGQPIVPRTAYEKERQRRQNWVERAGRAEAERDALAKQLEEAKKPPAPAADPPRFEPIDPAKDPVGYTRRVQGVMLNERLNTSEMMAVDKHGKEKIDAETAYFQQRAKTDPSLFQKLYSTPHPYQWMIDDNATARLHEEIGTDPAAYEAKLRAKWESERGADPPPVSPVAGMPPSLASARSAAPRGTNGFAGPPSLADILTRPERKR
jgi:hypothetical protein